MKVGNQYVLDYEVCDKYIRLSNDVLISVEDSDLILYITYALTNGKYARLRANPGKWKEGELLHRVIAERKFKILSGVVDHINNISLDNRRENLQLTSQRINSQKDRRAKSKYYRISFDSQRARWRVQFIVERGGRSERFGSFIKEEDAAYWSDVWAVRLLSEQTLLNFPNKIEEYLKVASSLSCERPWQRQNNF